MAKYLVIVESPAKAKTINKMLGPDYAVKASMGHVRDLPERALGVDIAHGFEPEYEVTPDRKKVIAELKKLAGGAEKIFLAPDPDREGEAIAWHLRELLKKGGKKGDGRFARVTYNEITEPAIRAAFANPGDLNLLRVDSQQARRILDRIIGFKVSPVLARRVSGARSAGRVQSVALRLVCEREAAIRGFVPEPYWVLGVKASKSGRPETAFRAKLARINGQKAEVKDEATAAAHASELRKRGLRTLGVAQSEKRRGAPPPFITSSLQQAASGACGFSPSRTMSLAQRLYEGMDVGGGTAGLITYMRTDSFTISAQAQAQAREFITKTWGPAFYPERPNRYKNRSSAQEAHEAIRPTDAARTPESLKGLLPADEWKLYDLVWRRFMASQMSAARIGVRTAELEATGGSTADEYLFRATASEVLFPGYMKALGMEKRRKGPEEGGEGDDDEVESLPDLAQGEVLDVLEWLNDRKETQPPARYSEAALVKALEENGVGRPSTYAQTLKTLVDRDYVTREKRMLVPTDMGMNVNRFLTEHLNELFAVPFTAEMEEELDEIEDGKVAWRDMLGTFYGQFLEWMKGVNGPEAATEDVQRLLDALGHVKQWRAPSQGRNRTYSDEKFVASLRKQAAAGTKGFTERQKQALERLCGLYRDQLPEGMAESLGLPAAAEAAPEAGGGDGDALERLNLLDGVEFHAPRTVGKRTYDDRAFWTSLRDQAAAGKTLSDRQWAAFDKMVGRYKDKIADFAGRGAKWYGKPETDAAAAQEQKRIVERLLAWFDEVKEWRAPTTAKGRTWDDRAFADSLRQQLRDGKQPTARQVAALKRLAGRYSDQLPDYAERAAEFGLGESKADAKAARRG